MALPINEEHLALADSVREVLSERNALAAARNAGSAEPPFWKDVVSLGWLGLHLPEECGGQGFGVSELAIVLEELGRVVAPGDFLPTVVASQVINLRATDDLRTGVLPSLCDGTSTAAIGGFGETGLEVTTTGTVSGDAGIFLGSVGAEILVVAAGTDVLVVRRGPGVEVRAAESMDLTRPGLRVRFDAAAVLSVLVGAVEVLHSVTQAFAAAESAGGARACMEAAVSYSKTREQFGRTIGSFQAVKHLCANMLVDTEIATAAAWDASRADLTASDGRLAAAVAADQAQSAFVRCAQRNIQVHGGIGFTWEHDAHLYLRRAYALRAVVDATGPTEIVVGLTLDGVTRAPSLELPEDANELRADVRMFRETYLAAPESEREKLLVRSGYAFPHWPMPFGRSAGPVEQLVVEEVLGDVPIPDLGIGSWIVPTLLQQGTTEQIDRWVQASLDGDIRWCQLFSEPGAGSDAAAISTRGVRTEGGWLITGQKVWTSDAHNCNRGLATVRTNRDAPKHAGVTMFVIDLTAAGVDIRPLRDIAGEDTFNEVFFDNVFVPDADVVGEVDGGWKVARATLGNERVTIGGGIAEFVDLGAAVAAVAKDQPGGVHRTATAHLLSEKQAMQMLALRNAARAVSGAGPGPEGNVTKLLSGEHQQRVADLLIELAGAGGVADGGLAAHANLLFVRGLTIAGGTSEVVRNQIAERVLGLPRDPS